MAHLFKHFTYPWAAPFALLLWGCFFTAPLTAKGATEKQVQAMTPLSPCPQKPNCIHSQSKSWDAYGMNREVAKVKKLVKQALQKLPRCDLAEEREAYLRFECRSALFGWIDDLEFYFDQETHKLEYKSAARKGYWDLGVNKRRMKGILHSLAELARLESKDKETP